MHNYRTRRRRKKKFIERSTIAGCSGDSKIDASERHLFQLLANMNKTAADLAYDSLKQGIIFSNMIIYGILVGYEQAGLTKLCELAMDFEKMTSSLKIVDLENMPIKTGFELVTSALKQHSLVPVD